VSAITALDLRFSVYFLRYFVLKGYAAGPYHDQAGGGSNFLCLPEVPQWKNYMSSHEPSGTIVGVEYEFHRMGPTTNDIFNEVNGAHSDRLGVCAFCYVQGRSTVAMIPARTQCPDGWTIEYAGYLATAYSHPTGGHRRSSYMCWSEDLEIALLGGINENQGRIYPVEVHCGALPCDVYYDLRELACIVCSK